MLYICFRGLCSSILLCIHLVECCPRRLLNHEADIHSYYYHTISATYYIFVKCAPFPSHKVLCHFVPHLAEFINHERPACCSPTSLPLSATDFFSYKFYEVIFPWWWLHTRKRQLCKILYQFWGLIASIHNSELCLSYPTYLSNSVGAPVPPKISFFVHISTSHDQL